MNKRELTEKLRSEVQLASGIKWSISASVEVSREKAQNGEPVIESETKTLVSATRELLRESGAEGSQLEESFLDLLNNAETLKMEGSNWMVTNIFYYEFNFALYKPLTGGSYLKTPEWLARKGTILNVKTKNNNQCFRLSILAALHPALRRASDPKTYTPNYNSLNFENIQSENMQIKDLPKFCNLNQDFSLSVIGVEKKDLFPLFCSKERKAVHITLLLLIKGTKRHFVLCRSLDTLLYSQNRHRGRKHFCCFCFNPHATLDARVSHKRDCKAVPPEGLALAGSSLLAEKRKSPQQPAPQIVGAQPSPARCRTKEPAKSPHRLRSARSDSLGTISGISPGPGPGRGPWIRGPDRRPARHGTARHPAAVQAGLPTHRDHDALRGEGVGNRPHQRVHRHPHY
ncbi:Protein piccolo [Frankliniella fusca]|uniref:Protein piccolo n=1 Tax=Frankliniella fusca TaxID=407009 RepID=A0AAE1I294_9NEOP|nr:Protein piccolo [Frankliniella fusca]